MHRRNPIRMFAIRITSLCLAALLVPQTVPVAAAEQEPEPQSAPQQSASPQSGSQQQPMPSPPALPSMPAQAQLQQSQAQDASLASQAALPSAPDPQTPSQQQAPQQPPALPQQPVGTAAAPAENPTGVPGSRPSGAAIAPAKQKRVRAFVISIGIALAAGAAIGTVVGLSKASHSTP